MYIYKIKKGKVSFMYIGLEYQLVDRVFYYISFHIFSLNKLKRNNLVYHILILNAEN